MPESDLARRLKAARESLQLSRRELAERAQLDVSAIARIERARRGGTRIQTRRQIARAFGVPLEALEQYLEGSIDLDAFQRARKDAPTQTIEHSRFDDAIGHAFDGTRHRLAHLDAVRAILARADTSRVPVEQTRTVARRLLDAAAALPAGEVPTCEALLLMLAQLDVPHGPAPRED